MMTWECIRSGKWRSSDRLYQIEQLGDRNWILSKRGAPGVYRLMITPHLRTMREARAVAEAQA